MIIINTSKSVFITVDILFWMPDHLHVIQQFIWQTSDVEPYYPRVNRFLHFWHKEIDAVIKEIRLFESNGSDISSAFQIGDMKPYGIFIN